MQVKLLRLFPPDEVPVGEQAVLDGVLGDGCLALPRAGTRGFPGLQRLATTCASLDMTNPSKSDYLPFTIHY